MRTRQFRSQSIVSDPYPGTSGSSAGVPRKLAQGAGAASLMLAGSGVMFDSPEEMAQTPPPVIDFSSPNGIAETLATGGMTGPLLIAGAVLIFLAAGRGAARVVGLMGAVSLFILHSQGVTLDEASLFAGDLATRLGAAVDAFRTASAG